MGRRSTNFAKRTNSRRVGTPFNHYSCTFEAVILPIFGREFSNDTFGDCVADVPAEAVAVDGDDDFHVAVLLALVGRRA
jgi:hypothetical protein